MPNLFRMTQNSSPMQSIQSIEQQKKMNLHQEINKSKKLANDGIHIATK